MALQIWHDPEDVRLNGKPVPNVESIIANCSQGHIGGTITLPLAAATAIANGRGNLTFRPSGTALVNGDLGTISIGGYDQSIPAPTGGNVTLPFITLKDGD